LDNPNELVVKSSKVAFNKQVTIEPVSQNDINEQ